MRLVRAERAYEIAQVKGTNVRDWRRHGFLDGVGVLKGQWQYDFRDILVLRLTGMLARIGVGPTAAIPLSRKATAGGLTKDWLLIGPQETLLFFDDLDDLVSERRRRGYLAAIHVPLGEVVKEIRATVDE